jgi:PleD family two-component response regulator
VIPEREAGTNSKLRALLAKDDPVFQHILRRLLLRWGYDVELAEDGPSAWTVLRSEDPPRLAILDWMMPGMDGVEICRNVRALDREPYTYIVLLTGRNESGDLVTGMDAGADDYVTKPFDAHELRVRLRAGSRIVNLQEELLQAREALREQATHDSLTGVLSRASILELLQAEISRGERARQPLVACCPSGTAPRHRSERAAWLRRFGRPSRKSFLPMRPRPERRRSNSRCR